MIEIRHYIAENGKDIFGDWLSSLKDIRTKAKIAARIERLSAGNFGDCKSPGRGLFEFRIDWGPGFRVYYAREGQSCILLLCAGDKSSQPTDIERAFEYLKDIRQRREKG